MLWPWGFTSTVAPNGPALQTLGRRFAYFNNYTPESSIGLYPTDGTTIDFAYGTLGVAAYTFEIGTAFFETCNSFESTVIPANMPALVYAAKVIRTPYQTPAGPEALNVIASPVNVPQGSPAALAATLNDTRFNNANGTEPTQNNLAAEYYVDVPPWDTAHGPTPHPMAAADGSFNSTVENVTAAVDTGSLTVGRHIIFVRGQDAAGNWGPFSAAFLDVTPCVAPAAPAGLTITRGSGLPDELQLAWTAPVGAVRYQVWRALNEAYFTPGADCSSPGAYACTETIATSYPDNVTADNPIYAVRALSTCGGYSDAAYQHVGRFRFSLIPGQ